jgi:hypothetical protein
VIRLDHHEVLGFPKANAETIGQCLSLL